MSFCWLGGGSSYQYEKWLPRVDARTRALRSFFPSKFFKKTGLKIANKNA